MSSGLVMDKPSSAMVFLPVKTEMDLNSHDQTFHSQVAFSVLFFLFTFSDLHFLV